MDEAPSVSSPSASLGRPPKTLRVFAIAAAAFVLLQTWPQLAPEVDNFGRPEPWGLTPFNVVSLVLSLIWRVIPLALVYDGLLRRSRFAWLLGLLLQLVIVGYGVLFVVANAHIRATLFDLWTIGFFNGLLPILGGGLLLVVLLLPSTRRWVSPE